MMMAVLAAISVLSVVLLRETRGISLDGDAAARSGSHNVERVLSTD